MAVPFGGHPTLQTYLNWLRSEGFSYHTGYIPADGGIALVRIEDAEGKIVFTIVDMAMDERLPPSTVSHYDAIFGVSSPYPKRD